MTLVLVAVGGLLCLCCVVAWVRRRYRNRQQRKLQDTLAKYVVPTTRATPASTSPSTNSAPAPAASESSTSFNDLASTASALDSLSSNGSVAPGAVVEVIREVPSLFEHLHLHCTGSRKLGQRP